MLYLMMDKKSDKYLVKIGVTRNLRQRRNNYKSHNPFAIMRSSCAGTEADERRCHLILLKIGKRVTGTEWFEINEKDFDTLYSAGMRYFKPNHNPIYFNEKF